MRGEAQDAGQEQPLANAGRHERRDELVRVPGDVEPRAPQCGGSEEGEAAGQRPPRVMPAGPEPGEWEAEQMAAQHPQHCLADLFGAEACQARQGLRHGEAGQQQRETQREGLAHGDGEARPQQ